MLTANVVSRRATRMPCDLLAGVDIRWDVCRIHPINGLVTRCSSRQVQTRTHSGAGFVKAGLDGRASLSCGNQAQSSFHYGFCALWPTRSCGTSVVICDHPATRASQSRKRGRIARARWLKQSGIVQAMTWLHTEASSKHRANFDFDHGKAVLCSNIHHQRPPDIDLTNTNGYDHATSTPRS
jgi:hypothetical protein